MAGEDWFSHNIPVWRALLAPFKGRPNLRFLEVGSYEGRSAEWLCENILTGEDCEIHCVDTFEGSQEHDAPHIEGMHERFHHRVSRFRKIGRLGAFKGRSLDVLCRFIANGKAGTYDFAYIDGSHASRDVIGDAVLAFHLLKDGGILLFDDFIWNQYREPDQNPRMAIDAFISCFRQESRAMFQSNQCWLQKAGKPKATPWIDSQKQLTRWS